MSFDLTVSVPIYLPIQLLNVVQNVWDESCGRSLCSSLFVFAFKALFTGQRLCRTRTFKSFLSRSSAGKILGCILTKFSMLKTSLTLPVANIHASISGSAFSQNWRSAWVCLDCALSLRCWNEWR